jgi:hypothetical protein
MGGPAGGGMSTQALTLYDIEDHYLALLNTEALVTPEFEQEFQRELEDALSLRGSKREAVFQFLLFLRRQRENGEKEIERLKAFVQHIETVDRRVKHSVVNVIRTFGKDEKGKYKTLDAQTGKMFLRALPQTVEILDEEQVPDEFKVVRADMPMSIWQDLTERYEHCYLIEKKSEHVDREKLEQALLDREVPGADLRMAGHDHTLIVK